MDVLNYKNAWGQKGKVPTKRMVARYGRHEIGMGLHPYLWDGGSALFDIDPFDGTEGPKRVSEAWQSDPRGCVHGHNVATDENILTLMEVDTEVPLSPLFVRDLAGRTVYIGLGPEAKTALEWDAYNAAAMDDEGRPAKPWLPLAVFPRHCREVDGRMEGAELLEQVFLLKFRNLDMGRGPVGQPSGAPDDVAVQAVYDAPNLYPYKYRPDTFYIDGWKLPQVQMLFAKQDGVAEADAAAAGDALLAAWAVRPEGTDYEDWLEAQGGEEWVDGLFAKGCTLIPTFEACNGMQVVSREFELEDYWPGRVVRGLHEVAEERADKAPVGTILEVLAPGYITARKIVPARVAVSDGSGYISPNVADPLPLIPNLNLPHSRTVAAWGSTWLPTHPEHFENPALWGWDLTTGRFLQLFGPLWDPLHYFYESWQHIYEAMRHPMDENRWLAPVPEKMKGRFYPIVPRKGFDVITFDALERRLAGQRLPISAVAKIEGNAVMADVGYHPLPPEFEFEIDTFWFPELHPRNREHGVCPAEDEGRVCPIVQPYLSVENYAAALPPSADMPWLGAKEVLREPSEDVLENYPYIARYLLPELPAEDLVLLAPLPYVGDVGEETPRLSAQEVWRNVDEFDDLENMASGLYDAVWEVREQALDNLKLRHGVYQMAPGLYKLAWWAGSTMAELQLVYAEWFAETRQAGGAGADVAAGEPERKAMAVPKMAVEEGIVE
ncbi:MAG: hypothetical protein H6922_01335 [Pseudomonadaceae bacterium]|nr:hypothetical protein [Pseudomonadaceae bacterium]